MGVLEEGDIRDAARLDEVIASHKPVAVLHCAALIEVGESVKEPGRFYENNVAGAINLIEAARRGGMSKWSSPRPARPMAIRYACRWTRRTPKRRSTLTVAPS